MATTSKPIKPAKAKSPVKAKAAMRSAVKAPAKKPNSAKAAAAKPAAKTAAKPVPKSVAKPTALSLPKPAKTQLPNAKPQISGEQRRHYVEVAAYFIAERSGFAADSALDHWTQAEAEIDRLLREGMLNA